MTGTLDARRAIRASAARARLQEQTCCAREADRIAGTVIVDGQPSVPVLLTIVRRFGDEARGQRPMGILGGNEVDAIRGQQRLTDEQTNATV